ncbi:bifunctional metallophosphatase/5'-nucleotidase [Planctomycetota bacterium]|nr:bifunctional metallophosphatase/5'-nucleotidase [Planctomycetota bacterium]
MAAAQHSPARRSGGWLPFFVAMGVAGWMAVLAGLQTEAKHGAQENAAPVALTILHTNDLHGQVLASGSRPGLVALSGTIRRERAAALQRGEAVLLLDAGDLFKGTPEGDLTHGKVIVAWMNHVGYDAVSIGNHEFDYGIDVARDLTNMASFPFLGANVIEEASGQVPAWLGQHTPTAQRDLHGSARVFEVGRSWPRARVAVIGLTTSEMKDVTLSGVTDGLTFQAEAAALERALGALPPVDYIVVLTHCGLSTDELLAEQFAGKVDVIVGGHSHTTLENGERVGPVLVAQAGSKTRWLGRVRTRVYPGSERRGAQSVASADLVPVSNDVAELLEPYVSDVRQIMDAQVGTLAEDLPRDSGYASSALGNLQTDLMRDQSGADVAFQNKTGVRDDLRAGPIRLRDLHQVSPFGNTVVRMDLSGADLVELLEFMLSESHKLLEVSGLTVMCDPSLPAGRRVLGVTVGTRPLDPEATYSVATNNFLAPGGDGHEAFTRGQNVVDSGAKMRDLLETFFRENDPYVPGPLDRRLRMPEGLPPPR